MAPALSMMPPLQHRSRTLECCISGIIPSLTVKLYGSRHHICVPGQISLVLKTQVIPEDRICSTQLKSGVRGPIGRNGSAVVFSYAATAQSETFSLFYDRLTRVDNSELGVFNRSLRFGVRAKFSTCILLCIVLLWN